MWLNAIQARLASDLCDKCLWSVGWLQGSLAYQVMFISFAMCIELIVVDLWPFGLLFNFHLFKGILVLSPPNPFYSGFFPLILLQCDSAHWRLPVGVVPTHRIAMVTSLLHLNCLGQPKDTSSWAHHLWCFVSCSCHSLVFFQINTIEGPRA